MNKNGIRAAIIPTPQLSGSVTLPAGESKCLNDSCSLKEECLRQVADDRRDHQVYSFYEPNDSISCNHLIKAFKDDDF